MLVLVDFWLGLCWFWGFGVLGFGFWVLGLGSEVLGFWGSGFWGFWGFLGFGVLGGGGGFVGFGGFGGFVGGVQGSGLRASTREAAGHQLVAPPAPEVVGAAHH